MSVKGKNDTVFMEAYYNRKLRTLRRCTFVSGGMLLAAAVLLIAFSAHPVLFGIFGFLGWMAAAILTWLGIEYCAFKVMHHTPIRGWRTKANKTRFIGYPLLGVLVLLAVLGGVSVANAFFHFSTWPWDPRSSDETYAFTGYVLIAVCAPAAVVVNQLYRGRFYRSIAHS